MESSVWLAPFLNSTARDWEAPVAAAVDPKILALHKTLPSYGETPLVCLPTLAKAMGLRSLYIKDESNRFGLPSFKILGASWAIYRATCSELRLPLTTSIGDLSMAAGRNTISLVTCSDGNWGRSVARVAQIFGIRRTTVFVPASIDKATRDKISEEGATCLVCPGDYDASVVAARKLANESIGALLVMDTSWEGYQDIPLWVTEGYSTMLTEVSAVMPNPTLVIVSVGVGSWAHAVVAHYKQQRANQGNFKTLVATVEPTAAASLLTSLHNGQITSIVTGETIMCGMNCGTTSTIAWPVLRDGVSAAIAVSDREADESLKLLTAQVDGWDRNKAPEKPDQANISVRAGPCGAAPLAALKKIMEGKLLEDLGIASDVVLFCTEGERDYIMSINQDKNS